MKQYDYCRTLLKNFCKVNNISPKRIRFQNIENLVVINIKNHLKVGVDLDCFKILNIINQTVVPLGIKFNQQLYLYPNGDRLARVDRKSKRLNYSHVSISYAVLFLKNNHIYCIILYTTKTIYIPYTTLFRSIPKY